MRLATRKLIANCFWSLEGRQDFYEEVAAMTSHRVTLKDSLTFLASRLKRRHHPLRFVFEGFLNDLKDGQPLDVCMAHYIPGEEAQLIKSGLDSGDLPQALNNAASIIKAKRSLIANVTEALGYPAFLVLLFFLVLILLSRYAMPQLAKLSNPELWDPSARFLYETSSFVDSGLGAAVLLIIVLLGIVSFLTLPYFTGPVRRSLDTLPPWSFYRLLVGSVWLFTIATMMRSGIQLSAALAEMADRSSPWLRERIEAILAGLVRGKEFGTALDAAGYQFPDRDLVEKMLVYSRLPGFDQQLQTIAENWLQYGITKIKKQAKIVNVVCIFCIATLIAGIGNVVISIQQHIGQGMTF